MACVSLLFTTSERNLAFEWKGERVFSACRELLIQTNEQKGAHENIPPVFNPMGVQIFSDGLFS